MKQLLTILSILFGSQIFAQNIEVITQEKTQGIVTILSYSPDGSILASGSAQENSIKIWDINSGKIIGKLEGHDGFTTAIMFNEDGTKILSSANDEYLILWDIIDWKMIDSVKLESPITWMVSDIVNKSIFYSCDKNGSVKQWNINELGNNQELYKELFPVVRLDAAKGKLVSGGNNGKVTIYDLVKKEIINSKQVHSSTVLGLKFYNDGQNLITTGGGGLVHLWNTNNLMDSKHIKASNSMITAFDVNVEKNRFVTASSTRRIRVWDFDGNEIFEFKDKLEDYNNSEPIRALQISPDGSTVASSGFAKAQSFRVRKGDNVIRIWDMNRGTLYKLLEGQVNPIYTFDFHPTANELVTLGEDRMLTFWDFNIAEKYGQFQLVETKREIPPKMKFWSKENINNRKDAVLGDIVNGNFGGVRIKQPKKPANAGKKVGTGMVKRSIQERPIVKFTSNGTYLITKLPKDEIRYYDLKEKKPNYIGPLWSYQTSINQIICSPDEKYLAVLGSGDSAVSILDMQTGEFMRKLLTPAPGLNFDVVYDAFSGAFSPDGSLFAVCFNTSKTFVFETESWNLVYENILPKNLGVSNGAFVNFSQDGKSMIVSSTLGLKKYDTKTFDILTSQKLNIQGRSAPLDKPSDFAITHNEDHFYIEHIFSGEYKQVLRARPKDITHISISPNGKFGITMKSGQFLLVDPASGEQEILLVADGDNYIFKTSDNFYKVSKEGYDLVTFRIGNKAYPFEQFDAVFNRPDLVLKKLGCQDEELMSLYKLAYEKRLKKMGLNPTTTVSLQDIPTLEITNTKEIPAITENVSVPINMKMEDHGALSSYNIYVNNVPIYGKSGKSLSNKKTLELVEEVHLVYGINKIQVSCRNNNGYESLMQTFYVEKTGVEPKRKLFLITIGTSQYKDNRFNLQYPVKDGKDLVALFNSDTAGVYSEVKSKSLYDKDVTVENVMALSNFLKTSGPDDVVLVFVAGHGVLDENFDYYFGTYDMDFQNPSGKGLAYDKLESILDGIKANKKILIMDTCHSGEIDKEDVFFVETNDEDKEDEDIEFRSVGPAVEENSGATPSRLSGLLFNDLRRGTGSTVISSAGGAEFAMESDEWRNGLFTYCLLNGLKNGSADLDKDGSIMLLELQEYVVERVSHLSHGKQIPNTRIKNLELDFRIW
ncbi:MAG: caspase family protein [Crocinitomicaceae bacterium]|nr:caspase family protein [Crocinitomicaceae bacterium]